jgi:ribA/ribD-fused uncharacterized protein
MYPASSDGLNKETEEAVYFFTTAFHPLDPYSAHAIYLWGQDFPTAEHAFQWKKFSECRPEIAAKILSARSPEAVKEISNAHKADQPTDWRDVRVAVMEEIFTAKTDQHKDVQEILVETGNREIIENSPIDNFWGIGPAQDGQNIIGKIWMKIRG